MSTLILTAHGSRDPRSAANAHAVAERLRSMRPGLDVRLGFLELNAPNFADVLGEDVRLVSVLHERLAESGVSPDDDELGVVVVAIGSSHAAVNARTAQVPSMLAAGTRWAGATIAFATRPEPSVAQAIRQVRRRGARRVVMAPWFLAPGRITDRVSTYARENGIPMAAPLGDHPLVAETLLDRYEQALAEESAA